MPDDVPEPDADALDFDFAAMPEEDPEPARPAEPEPEPVDPAGLPRLMPEVETARYHRDPFAAPSLSASIARIILDECPLRAWLAHPKLGGISRGATPRMERGTLVHALVFNQPLDIEIVHHRNFRRKRDAKRRTAAREENRICVLASEFERAKLIAEAIVTEAAKQGIELRRGGLIETPAAWTEDTEAGPIVCRGIFDWVHVGEAAALDLKTCRSANPRDIMKAVIEHGYDIQAEAYKSALRKLNPDMAGRETFRWLFIEELPAGAPQPIILTVAEADGALAELGAARWRDACETWARCTTANQWPAYTTGTARIAPPAWALREEFER